mgnify:CR=1 FL=1
MDGITKNVSVQGGNRLLKLSLKQGEYLNIGDNIRVVYAGGAGNHIRLLVDDMIKNTLKYLPKGWE